MRDVFESWGNRGQFAGHETFPLRLLWLKKAHDAVEQGAPVGLFSEPEAIARFGVGRNMAVSMRHWAIAAGTVQESDRRLEPTPLGSALLSEDGWDPFLEKPATLWLVHWQFSSEPRHTTTIFFAFNAIATADFDAAGLVENLQSYVARYEWRASPTTLKRDVEVLLRSYVRRNDSSIEDAAEPLLAELGLIRELPARGRFEFVIGPKPTLPDAVFAYALQSFWKSVGAQTSLAAESICFGPGSPGRVFKMDPDSVISRLMRIEKISGGAWEWTETAGLKQVHKRGKDFDPIKLLGAAYKSGFKPPRALNVSE